VFIRGFPHPWNRNYSLAIAKLIIVDKIGLFIFTGLMQVDGLRVFCMVFETEHFTRAALKLGVTQSAVSQAIGALEKTLATRLIERSAKKFRVTPAGQVVYEHSRQIVDLETKLEKDLDIARRRSAATLRVATTFELGLHLLPRYLERLRRENPGVHVRVEHACSSQVYREVLGNNAELGLVDYPKMVGGLRIVPVRKEPWVLISSPEQQLGQREEISLRDLDGQKFISFEPDASTRSGVRRALKRGRAQVNRTAEFDNIDMVKRAVAIGLGVSLVPQDAVADELNRRSLKVVRLKPGALFRPLAVICRKTRCKEGMVVNEAAEKLIELLKEDGLN
jgi:DNA-binding transcriptional LysR family regulator